mmetsp:Transcript_135631/g.270633  ORF Transcript_135631/g.270633 Transcript_135631/m.270633 type:complete len:80 (+) Transcript_135631:922-1161(+)
MVTETKAAAAERAAAEPAARRLLLACSLLSAERDEACDSMSTGCHRWVTFSGRLHKPQRAMTDCQSAKERCANSHHVTW